MSAFPVLEWLLETLLWAFACWTIVFFLLVGSMWLYVTIFYGE